MATICIIGAILLWLIAGWTLFRNQLLSPAISFLAMLAISYATTSEGVPLIPINGTILMSWLGMTLVVMAATMLQPQPIRMQQRGVGYMLMGALTGMVVGLIGFTFTLPLQMLYGIMVIATLAGLFFGYLFFTRTPQGVNVGLHSGHFFRYLLAKGFPVAISVMILGVVLVIYIATQQI
jgi:hypothetical protein